MNIIDTTPSTYMTQHCVMPFCKGCGHSHVLRRLDEALVNVKLSPEDVCLVTDIGCIGLADALFEIPHTVHTTHGRSTAFATGIKLAEGILSQSKLKIIVLIGDGGAMIGLLHLINAAQLNVDITVLLCNNFLFGMTGGQNSAFSPLDFVTPTTPHGNIIPPIDLCKIVEDAHAGFVARKLATDKDLGSMIARAIEYPGFSFVEIVELCTEHATTRNPLSGTVIAKMLREEHKETGVLTEDLNRKEFGKLYIEKFPKGSDSIRKTDSPFLPVQSENNLLEKIGIVIAGSAGERVQSTAGIFCEAAARSGLQCTQKSDNPVTQGSGFSLSEMCISPTEIHYTGIDKPEIVIAVSDDGLQELFDNGTLDRISRSSLIILDSTLTKHKMDGSIFHFPFRSVCGEDKAAAAALMLSLSLQSIFPQHIFEELLRQRYGISAQVFPDQFYSFIKGAKQQLYDTV